MLVPIIVFIISFLLDGISSNFLPYMVGDLSYFTPLLTIVSIIIVYPFFTKRLHKYYISCFLIGIFYDFMYTDLLFFNGILFLGVGMIVVLLYRYIEINWFTLFLFILIGITSYECMTAIVIIIFQLVPMTFYRLLYKIFHSLLLNIIYGEFIYFIIYLLPTKYKKLTINS